MPTARCISCNKRIHYRNQRGYKLSNTQCECGGKFESVGGNYYVRGKNPFEPEKTYTSQYLFGEFFYAEANRKGELFYSHPDKYYKPIINAIQAQKNEPQ